MNSFVELDTLIGAVPFQVVTQLRAVDMAAGSEDRFRTEMPELFINLADRARVGSIEASSAIEGIVVQDRKRAEEITAGHAIQLRDRSEQELAGYRAALDYLYQDDWTPFSVGLLLHLHRLLFQYTPGGGGTFKTTDNLVVDRLPDGSVVERLRPVSAVETPHVTTELIARYQSAIEMRRHHPLLLTGLFALDLLTIHPFSDGNGRVTRALTNALLMQNGYGACRYVSLEYLVAESADAYYASLRESTIGWHEHNHDPWPWLTYFVSEVSRMYAQFADQVERNQSANTKQEIIRNYVRSLPESTFRLADIQSAFPAISLPTIRLALTSLKTEGIVDSSGAGRGAVWVRRRS